MNDKPKQNLDIDIFVTTENELFIKLAGFECIHEVEEYATFLADYLPLMLFQSTVVH